uniref:Beta-defensin-like domain-containing protein n=1 Tax=Gopherus evgoodei TaxID=1825980 RepID=A0A8C4W5E0_9SAUR
SIPKCGLFTSLSVLGLTLFLCAGFTHFINDPEACRRAGGFCLRRCAPYFTPIGSCGIVQSCCRRRWVSSGCHKTDVIV